MWLQILLFLGIVVCSFSAPTHSPALVTRPWKHVDAIKEALSLLNDTPAMEVSEEESSAVSRPPAGPCLALPVSLVTWPFPFTERRRCRRCF